MDESKRTLVQPFTPNVAQWRSSLISKDSTRTLVNRIISKKKEVGKVFSIPQVLGTERLEEVLESNVVTRDKRLFGDWKAWKGGEKEKRAETLKLARRKKEKKQTAPQSLIPDTLLANPDFAELKSASVPELIRKRISIEKDLRHLKKMGLNHEEFEENSWSGMTEKDEFKAEKYAPRLGRSARTHADSLDDEHSSKKVKKLDIHKIYAKIMEENKPKLHRGKAVDVAEVGTNRKYKAYRKQKKMHHNKHLGGSAHEHRDAEHMLQKAFLLRYMANGIDDPLTTEAKNQLLHCYKLSRRGMEFIELSKTPTIHAMSIREAQHLGYKPSKESDGTRGYFDKIESPESQIVQTSQVPSTFTDDEVSIDCDGQSSVTPSMNRKKLETYQPLEQPEWVVGVSCQQSIQMRAARKFDKKSYFQLYFGVHKTQYLPWDISSEHMTLAISSFKEVYDDLCDVQVEKTENPKLGHYEWKVSLFSRNRSLPLLQVWTPHRSPLQFAVQWSSAGQLSESKHASKLNTEAGLVPHILSPKLVKANNLSTDIIPTMKIRNSSDPVSTQMADELSPRLIAKDALERGNYKLAAEVALQDIVESGPRPGSLRVFHSSLGKISDYPKRNEFHIRVQLKCPSYIILCNSVSVDYVVTMVDKPPGHPHHELDWIGVFFIGGDDTVGQASTSPESTKDWWERDIKKPRALTGVGNLVSRAFVPEGNAGTVIFFDATAELGIYQVRYGLKGSESVFAGDPVNFITTHPEVVVKTVTSATINEKLEIPVEYLYTLGKSRMEDLDEGPPDWAGIFALEAPVNELFGHFDHGKPLTSILLSGSAGSRTFAHGQPKFPGKYEIRVISGRHEDVVLGKSKSFEVDAVSHCPSMEELAETRDIMFYFSAPPRGTVDDRRYFYDIIMPNLVHLCDERRVSFSVVDPYLQLADDSVPMSADMVDTFVRQIVHCCPYGLYFVPHIYGEIPPGLSARLIKSFPWLQSYDNSKPGCGLSLQEIELMVGLIVPQFQHDNIALNSIVCLQSVEYIHTLKAREVPSDSKIFLEGGDSDDAQFDLRERLACTDAMLVKDYYQAKSLNNPLIRSFRKLINRQFSKRDTPTWLEFARQNATQYLKSFSNRYIDIFPTILERLSAYAFGNSKFDRLLYHKPMCLASESHGGGSTSILAGWISQILPRKVQFSSVIQFQHRKIGFCTVITICFESTSTRTVNLGIRRALFELKRLFGFEGRVPTKTKEILPLLFAWSNKLNVFGRVIFIFDGMDHLEELTSSQICFAADENHHHHEQHGHRGINEQAIHETGEDDDFEGDLSENSFVSSSSSKNYGHDCEDKPRQVFGKYGGQKDEFRRKRCSQLQTLLNVFKEHRLPRNVRVIFSMAKTSECFQFCSETWNLTSIPRLQIDHRQLIIRQFYDLYDLGDPEINPLGGDRYGALFYPGDMVRHIQVKHQLLKRSSEPTDEEEVATKDTNAEWALNVLFSTHPGISKRVMALLYIASHGISELEMTYAVIEAGFYAEWLQFKDILSPYFAVKILGYWCLLTRNLREVLEGVVSKDDIKLARRTFLKIFSHRTYTACGREATVRPFLLNGKTLQKCLTNPLIFDRMITEEHWPKLLTFLHSLKILPEEMVQLVRRSIESFYNVGYLGRNGKSERVYNYHRVAKPPRHGGTLNVTVADFRRDVARQLVGCIQLLLLRKHFLAAENAAVCAICLNLGVLRMEDIHKGNLVDLEACEKSSYFLAFCHKFLDVNVHIHKATHRKKAEQHEKNMRKKEKGLMTTFRKLNEKNVNTKSAEKIVQTNRAHRAQIRRIRVNRRSHSATRELGSRTSRFPMKTVKSYKELSPYL